jgi:hypothetical protein
MRNFTNALLFAAAALASVSTDALAQVTNDIDVIESRRERAAQRAERATEQQAQSAPAPQQEQRQVFQQQAPRDFGNQQQGNREVRADRGDREGGFFRRRANPEQNQPQQNNVEVRRDRGDFDRRFNREQGNVEVRRDDRRGGGFNRVPPPSEVVGTQVAGLNKAMVNALAATRNIVPTAMIAAGLTATIIAGAARLRAMAIGTVMAVVNGSAATAAIMVIATIVIIPMIMAARISAGTVIGGVTVAMTGRATASQIAAFSVSRAIMIRLDRAMAISGSASASGLAQAIIVIVIGSAIPLLTACPMLMDHTVGCVTMMMCC